MQSTCEDMTVAAVVAEAIAGEDVVEEDVVEEDVVAGITVGSEARPAAVPAADPLGQAAHPTGARSAQKAIRDTSTAPVVPLSRGKGSRGKSPCGAPGTVGRKASMAVSGRG